MSVHPIAAAEVLARLDSLDALIDARSESEYAHDHLPGALNWPSLDDAERARVGTLYRQVSPFEARKLGASLVSANIARHIARHVMERPKGWQPVVYCWRGGQRSGALSLVLGQIGFRVHKVEGGYKALRAALLADMAARLPALRFCVLAGATGCGKTRLLRALRQAGAQVLDLEALACHRASVLGAVPEQPQPSQKAFETRIWDALRHFDAGRVVFVEAESTRIGQLRQSEALVAAVRAGDCLRVTLPQHERVALLLEDYPHFATDAALFSQRLAALTVLRGHATVARWQALAHAGDTPTVVRELLQQHYDPGYEASSRRHFAGYAQARNVALPDRTPASFARAAQRLIADTDGARPAHHPAA